MSDFAADVLLVIGCVCVMLVFIAMRADREEHKLHRVLRVLILAEVAFGLLWVVATELLKSSLPPELQRFVQQQKSRELGVDFWLSGCGFLLVVVGWIGLWRLWWRARAVYSAGWLLGVVTTLFKGPRVYPGPPGAAALLSTIAAGLILGIIYFSDLRQRFGRPRMEARVGAA